MKVETLHNCPYCRDRVAFDEPQRICEKCLTRHHIACWQEYGRCATFGCEHTECLEKEGPAEASRSTPTTDSSRTSRWSAMGSTASPL